MCETPSEVRGGGPQREKEGKGAKREVRWRERWGKNKVKLMVDMAASQS